MKTNDALLSHIINRNEKYFHKLAKLITDERIETPTEINVGPNEVVYLHFFHSNVPDFSIDIKTATDSITLDRKNTFNGDSNTILRALSNITFTPNANTLPPDFFVQILRIQY